MKHLKAFEFYKSNIEYYNYLNLEEVENGILIYISEEPKDYLLLHEYEDKYEIFGEMEEDNFSDYFEDIQSNSEYTYVHDLGEIGLGLTSAPGIIKGYYFGDDGNLTCDDEDYCEVYYFDNYQIESFTDILKKDGKVFFTKA